MTTFHEMRLRIMINILIDTVGYEHDRYMRLFLNSVDRSTMKELLTRILDKGYVYGLCTRDGSWPFYDYVYKAANGEKLTVHTVCTRPGHIINHWERDEYYFCGLLMKNGFLYESFEGERVRYG